MDINKTQFYKQHINETLTFWWAFSYALKGGDSYLEHTDTLIHFYSRHGGGHYAHMPSASRKTGRSANGRNTKEECRLKLVIAEKPSVAMSLAAVLGANEKRMGTWRETVIW